MNGDSRVDCRISMANTAEDYLKAKSDGGAIDNNDAIKSLNIEKGTSFTECRHGKEKQHA